MVEADIILQFAQEKKMKTSIVTMLCVAAFGICAVSAPAFAQQKTEKACKDEWQANKAANQAAKITEKDYVAKCRADTAAAKPAAPAAAPAPAAASPAAAPAKPSAMTPAAAPAKTAAPATGGKAAENTRIKACGAEWKEAKAAGKTAGQKWPQFWSECDKRKKAAGM
jgi:hypothetical protein